MKPLRKELHIRLHVNAELAEGNSVSLNKEQSHYLVQVMRQKLADRITLFNGRDGEWIAELIEAEKNHSTALVREQTRKQNAEPDIWLLFAPLKNNKNEKLVEQAVELGVSRIHPLLMRHGIVDKINQPRLQAHAVEASEQCERLSVPEVLPLQKLDAVFKNWDAERLLVLADESGAGLTIGESFKSLSSGGKYAAITGPEGGFAEEEFKLLRALPFTRPVSLGPRILKADTAAIALLACMQAALGDWPVGKPSFRH